MLHYNIIIIINMCVPRQYCLVACRPFAFIFAYYIGGAKAQKQVHDYFAVLAGKQDATKLYFEV